MRVALALLVLTVLAFLPHFDYPEWRGTEARRVQIAAEMVVSGDYVVPRLWGAETYAKPPLYYWVLAAHIHLFGLEPWSMRLPSVLGFWILALAAFHFLKRWHDPTTAWLGAAGILLSPVLMFDGPFAEIDPFFSVLTVLSLLCLSDGIFDRRRGMLVLAGILGGLAVMAKGPPYLMFFVGPFVIWWRRSRLAGFFWYLPFVIGFYAIYKVVLESVGPAEDVASVAVQESLGRLSFWTEKSLKGIPAYLVRSVLVVGLPFTPWLLPWFCDTRRRTDAASARQNLLLWGAIGAMAALLFSRGRSMRYLMPAVSMVILGLAPLVAVSLRSLAPPPTWARRVLLSFGVLAALGLLAVPWLPYPYPGTTGIALLALGAVALCVHRQALLVRYALVVPIVVSWTAFPDRVAYFATAGDFAPDPAAVLARELDARGIDEVVAYGEVGTSLLLHTRGIRDRLPVRADPQMRRAPTAPWLVVQDRGYVKYEAARERDLRVVPGYREVLRVQMGRKKSISLRQRL